MSNEKIGQNVDKIPSPDVAVKNAKKSEKNLKANIEDPKNNEWFKNINSKEDLKNKKNHEIVKFVTESTDTQKVMNMFFTETNKNEFKLSKYWVSIKFFHVVILLYVAMLDLG